MDPLAFRSLTLSSPQSKEPTSKGSQDGQGSVKTGPRFSAMADSVFPPVKADQTKPSIWTKETQEASAQVAVLPSLPLPSVTLVLNTLFLLFLKEKAVPVVQAPRRVHKPAQIPGVTAGD